jgi:hypothetical protein
MFSACIRERPTMRDEEEIPRRDSVAARASGAIAAGTLGLAWPILEPLGANPPFFVARGEPGRGVLVTALTIGLVLPAAMGVIALIPGRVGLIIRNMMTSLAWLFLVAKTIDQWIPSPWVLVLAAVGGVAITVLSETVPAAAQMIRYLALSPLMVTAYFLLATPAGGLLTSRPADIIDVDIEYPHPLVMLVFDEFPTSVLMDSTGALREDRFPGFARLASDAIWFRNAATLQQSTDRSVPGNANRR